jgi:hypothetical protein
VLDPPHREEQVDLARAATPEPHDVNLAQCGDLDPVPHRASPRDPCCRPLLSTLAVDPCCRLRPRRNRPPRPPLRGHRPLNTAPGARVHLITGPHLQCGREGVRVVMPPPGTGPVPSQAVSANGSEQPRSADRGFLLLTPVEPRAALDGRPARAHRCKYFGRRSPPLGWGRYQNRNRKRSRPVDCSSIRWWPSGRGTS